MITIKVAIRNIARRSVRSLLTILGVAIGVAAVVGISAIAKGLQHDVKVAISGSASLIVKSKAAPDPLSSVLDESIEDEVRKIPGVKRTVAVWFNNRMITVGRQRQPILIAAVENRGYELVVGSKIEPIEGHLPKHGEMAFGSLIWRKLRPKVGETVDLSGQKLRVSGAFKTSSQLANMCAITTLDSVNKIRGKSISCVFVQTSDPKRVRKEIESRINGVEAITTSKAVQGMLNNLRTVELAAIALTGIAGVVGALGVANTMLMSVIERKREIGVMKAIGATNRDVMKLFLLESIILSLAGGIIGCVLGMLGSQLLVHILSYIKHQTVSVLITPEVLGLGLALALAIGVVSGLYPAWKAAKVDPVEALRYE
ncbi:ABC transporter permease [Methanopyrus kandleri]|uniref:Permease subunit of a ABC-type transport system involved in lipoprotein release n=2 Tax=Methanopyrus kandleri TaxID=2320 RepID=Q8TUU8_METKA|nr:FtsX-like permease family protein [Methanopyrus kandleri]AAM02868.1 Permease subunit of a ABC-type transport system involved in lipoprotein release [Methanopyrus kandleri AV19]HII70901.1 ABC transporter permease [Methanopyrus kandleri]